MATAMAQPENPIVVREKIPLNEVDELNGLTSRVQRLKQQYLDAQSAVCADRAWFMMESFKGTEGEHPAIRRAKALRNVFERMPIAIREGQLLVGAPTPFIRGAHPNVESGPRHIGILLKMHKPSTGSSMHESLLSD
jgi:hypothetical protein